MSDNKQTAVSFIEKNIRLNMNSFELLDLFDKAKKLEKQQIVEARNSCKVIVKSSTGKTKHEDVISDEYWTSHLNSDSSVLKVNVSSNKDGEQYYSQTYN